MGFIADKQFLLCSASNDSDEERRFQLFVRYSAEGHPHGSQRYQDGHVRDRDCGPALAADALGEGWPTQGATGRPMQPVAKIRLADGKTDEPVALIGSMSDA